jgi:hypothetical protein
MDVIGVLAGVALLLLGRKLFWLFVGIIGFVAGVALATQLFEIQPDWLVIVFALGAGLLGALLAVFLKRMAIGLAGFIAGGYILIFLLEALGTDISSVVWLPFLVGGIVGLILVVLLIDWALIALSALVGASLIVQSVHLGPQIGVLLFLVLLTVGIAIQASIMRRNK